MIAERTTVDLAQSDLIVSRVRSHFGFDFIGAENTPPGLINDAILSCVGRYLNLQFSDTPIGDTSSYRAANLNVWVNSIDHLDWDEFTTVVDAAVSEFKAIETRTTHAARLIFMFSYDIQTDVSSDVRRDFLAPMLDRFPGRYSYVDPESYPATIRIDEWNVHPTGMPLAWEGEHAFDERIALTEIDNAVRENYGVSLRQGWPTLLPVNESQHVPVRITLMPRFF